MITDKDVKYIGALARIHLTDQEIAPLTKNLEGILNYVKKLEKLDITNVKPTSHVLPLKNVYRDDVVKPSLSQAEALSIAVEKYHGAFQVPKVIE